MIVYFAWDGFGKVMHQSIPPAPSPSPPTTALSVPGVGHLQIFHCPGAGYLPTPGPFPSFQTRTRFPIRIKLHRGFYWKKSRLAYLSRIGINWRGLQGHVLDFMHAFLHCLSSQSYIAKLELSMWINVINININIIWRTSFHNYKTIHNIEL